MDLQGPDLFFSGTRSAATVKRKAGRFTVFLPARDKDVFKAPFTVFCAKLCPIYSNHLWARRWNYYIKLRHHLLSYSCRAKLGYLEKKSDWELHRGDSSISVRSVGTDEDSSEDPMKKRREQGNGGLAEVNSIKNNIDNNNSGLVRADSL